MTNNMRTGKDKTFVVHPNESARALLTSRLNDCYCALPFDGVKKRLFDRFGRNKRFTYRKNWMVLVPS